MCSVGVVCEKCLLGGSIYLSVKFEYVHFPIGILETSAVYLGSVVVGSITRGPGVVRLCSCRFN